MNGENSGVGQRSRGWDDWDAGGGGGGFKILRFRTSLHFMKLSPQNSFDGLHL